MSRTDDFSICYNHTWDTSGTTCIECGLNLVDKNYCYDGEKYKPSIFNAIGAWNEYGDIEIDEFIKDIYDKRRV